MFFKASPPKEWRPKKPSPRFILRRDDGLGGSLTQIYRSMAPSGGEGMTSDRVEIRAQIFFLGVYIKHSCFIVPNHNSKFSRCWGDFFSFFQHFAMLFFECHWWYCIDLYWWIRKNQGGAATSFQSSDLATGRHSAAESLWNDFSGRLHWRSHFPWQRFANVQPRPWEATTLSPWPLATLQALSKLS